MTQAVDYLRLRIGQPSQVLDVARRRNIRMPSTYYGRQKGLARQLSWSFAGASSLDQVDLVYRSLLDAMERGDNFEQWRQRVARGEVPLNLPRHRLETMFRTTMQSNYSRGLGERVLANVKTHPYLLYSAVNDSRTRPTHSKMHGIILPVHDPWWNAHRPPNGYNCRCRVIALTEREATKRGLTKKLPPPDDTAPDTGWAYDPWADPKRGTKIALRRKRRNPRAPQAAAQIEQAADAQAWENVDSTMRAIAIGQVELDQILDAVAPANRAVLTEVEALAVRAKIVERIRAVHGAPVKARVDKAQGIGGPAAHKRVKEMIERASEYLPASWVQATNGYGPLKVIASGGRGGSWSHDGISEVGKKENFGMGRRVKVDAPFQGIIWTSSNWLEFRTALHEYVHRVQYALPKLDELFAHYHRQRTVGDRMIKYNGEDVFPDQFLKPYFGRYYISKTLNGPLEMMTMSLQYLLDPTNPSNVQGFMNRDREFTQFVLGLLLRWRP